MADHWDHTVAVREIWRADPNMPDLTLELISLDNPWTRPRSLHGRRLWNLVLYPLCKGGRDGDDIPRDLRGRRETQSSDEGYKIHTSRRVQPCLIAWNLVRPLSMTMGPGLP
jgi:hypothetical protein